MKIIRDTIHGDIEFQDHELRVIHTAEFQRLHGCRQLGLTYLVYPGAKHSRFEHVLGVMHVATRIANRLEGQKEFFQDSDAKRLKDILRLAALLHDIAHLPFGHTLEDEMPLITEHDAPSEATEPPRWRSMVSNVLEKSGNAEFTDSVIQVLGLIAASKDDKKLYDLVRDDNIEPQFLVLADIIGNTICADLLDYIRRDHLLTGIHAVYDDRIFQYFGVAPYDCGDKSYPRLIIRLVRNGRVRYDCLADLLDILKLRYNLSDKVLFHPKKCAADAMLIRAMADLHPDQAELESFLTKFSDDGLLDKHREHPLIEQLRSRKLFKPVFVCRREHIWSYNVTHDKDRLIQRLHADEAFRRGIEKKIETELGLPTEQTSVLIYCPQLSMTRKPVRVLVQWNDGTIRRLNGIPRADETFTHDQVDVLERMYDGLWKLYLFVRSDLRTRGHQIKEKFVEILKADAGFDATCDPAFANYLEKRLDYKMGRRLDDELERTEEYRKLTDEIRVKALSTCHERLPLGEFDEDYEDIEATTVASRVDESALSTQVRELIRSVLIELKSGRGNEPGLFKK